MGKAVIVAAHPDDELLGLGSLIRDRQIGTVYYVNRHTETERLNEARGLGREYGFEVKTAQPDSIILVPERERIYVPAPTDMHVEHQEALTWAIGNFGGREMWEYSIEKAAPYVTPNSSDLVQWKRDVFAEHYPSQEKLLLDPKYFLFEGTACLGIPSITVSFSQVGFHCWPDAPAEVEYLRAKHRHRFDVKLTLKNLHRVDREQEFHLVQAWAKGTFDPILNEAPKHGWSCEEMARRLAVAARLKYRTNVEVHVSEDGENGSTVGL